jgi:DNA-binding response OmpR family regulator
MQRALVIDDDAQVLSLTKAWLLDAGYDVMTASTFEEGHVAIRRYAPPIIVSDVRLGEFNGLHLGHIARLLAPDVRLVFVSGWDDPVLRRDAASLGAAYLRKPVRAAELLSALLPASPARCLGPLE